MGVGESTNHSLGEDAEPDESQLEPLTAQLRANPNDHDVALKLARLLCALGRDLELLALLSPRIEEADASARADFVPMRREVLDRLAVAARSEGRASEAEIYELMRDAE
jgi:thioredoxin-like negative regulator of GroEL